MKYTHHILLVIFIISFFTSTILALAKTPPLCENGCDLVRTSKYSYSFGIKNDFYGAFAFLFLSIITYLNIKKPSKNKKYLINLGVVLGSIVGLYFIYLQKFVIKAYCKYCLVIDLGMLLCLSIMLINLKEQKT